MQALVYHHSVPRYLMCMLLAKLRRKSFFPSVAPLNLRDVEFSLPDEDWAKGWVTLRVKMCGICGSDLSLLRGAESMLLEPYGSFPATIGHEIIAEVAEAPDGSGFQPGERVVVEPVLSCAVRGCEPCAHCKRGDYNICENFLTGPIAPGPVLGYNASVGGGMAEYMFAHPERLHKVPDSVPDEVAVLADSLASALQPVLDNFPGDDDTVVVLGAGIIGQHLIRCLRALGFGGKLIAVARHGFQQELAKAGGADHIVASASRKSLAQALGAKYLKTSLGGGNMEGGADLFYDCAGGSRTLQEGLLALRGKGRYVMVGTANAINKVDVSSLWFRQLTMTGTMCYSHGTVRG
ncbi:MAG: alcohol dehydrogenase, partial [Desulfovibrio sp.]